MEIDIERLRKDLENYFGAAMFNGFPAAMMDLEDVKRADDDELIEIARRSGFNINNYRIQDFER